MLRVKKYRFHKLLKSVTNCYYHYKDLAYKYNSACRDLINRCSSYSCFYVVIINHAKFISDIFLSCVFLLFCLSSSCVFLLFCFSSSCVSYVASFSGLFLFCFPRLVYLMLPVSLDCFCFVFLVLCILCCQFLWIVFVLFSSSCVSYVASFSGLFLFCFSSSCVSYVAIFSGLFIFDCAFSIL